MRGQNMKDFEEFTWNDGMCEDTNAIWFVGCQVNALFQLQKSTGKIKFVKKFPNINLMDFRKFSICKKYKNFVYCFPDIGNIIWIYDILHDSMEKIDIMSHENERQGIMNAFLHDNHFFAVSITQKQIIEIDLENNKIVHFYQIFTNAEEKLGWECIEVEGRVYCVSKKSDTVCEFDMKNRNTQYYEIPVHTTKGFNTICYDDGKFWLSGNEEKLITWEKNSGKINVLNYKIDDFYTYKIGKMGSRQLFLNSVAVNGMVWFIPYLANKIIYVDKQKMVVKSFEIAEEMEDEENILQRCMQHKYMLQYISEGRFIWLYSFKDEKVLEIDTIDSCLKTVKFKMEEKSKEEVWKYWIEETQGMVEEINKKSIDRLLKETLKKEKKEWIFKSNIGKNIHERIMDTKQ